MNYDTIQGRWRELRGDVKARWAKLTDDDLDFVDGRVEALIGRIQQRYGEAREKARDAVDRWLQSLESAKG